MTERITEHDASVAVEHVRGLLQDFRAGSSGAITELVHVIDVHVQTNRRAARRRRRTERGISVTHHEHRAFDRHLGMYDDASGRAILKSCSAPKASR